MMNCDLAIAEIADQGFTIVRDLIIGDRLKQLQPDAEQLLHQIPAKGVDGNEVAGACTKAPSR
jgi:hypothetical protein